MKLTWTKNRCGLLWKKPPTWKKNKKEEQKKRTRRRLMDIEKSEGWKRKILGTLAAASEKNCPKLLSDGNLPKS